MATFSDVVVHGHKDRPAMSGAIDDLISGSHANILDLILNQMRGRSTLLVAMTILILLS
ncbi:MAG: hypothetical protein IPL73_12305 [Candidatus Obscuribacter sp.]|nr:hypothetical protein [Candidatus Obscuribacter sp.]